MPRAEPLEISRALGDLEIVYGERLSDRADALYRQALDDLSVGELAAAVDWLLRNHERYFPTPAEIRKAAFVARPELPELPPPEHRLFAPDNDDRSPEEIIAERELLAPRWAELRRALTDRGHELAAPRRIAANDDDFRAQSGLGRDRRRIARHLPAARRR